MGEFSIFIFKTLHFCKYDTKDYTSAEVQLLASNDTKDDKGQWSGDTTSSFQVEQFYSQTCT